MARCFRFQGRNHLTKKRFRLFLHLNLPLFIAGCVCKRFFYFGQKPLCERFEGGTSIEPSALEYVLESIQGTTTN